MLNLSHPILLGQGLHYTVKCGFIFLRFHKNVAIFFDCMFLQYALLSQKGGKLGRFTVMLLCWCVTGWLGYLTQVLWEFGRIGGTELTVGLDHVWQCC